ncbi:hypothetical protein D1872_58370 [compost metagenome]
MAFAQLYLADLSLGKSCEPALQSASLDLAHELDLFVFNFLHKSHSILPIS